LFINTSNIYFYFQPIYTVFTFVGHYDRMNSAFLTRKVTNFSVALLLTGASFFTGATAAVAQDVLEDGPRESFKTNPGDSQEKADVLAAVTNKLEAQITHVQTAVKDGSLDVTDANIILTKVRNLLTNAVRMQSGAVGEGGLKDIAKQTGTLVVAVSRMIETASQPSVQAERDKPEPESRQAETAETPATDTIIQQTLQVTAQAKATLMGAEDLAGALAGTARTVDQSLGATTQGILETQGMAREVIADANDGLAAIDEVSAVLGNVTSSVSDLANKSASDNAEALIAGLLGTVSRDINGVQQDTRQARTESRAVLDQTDQLLAQGKTVQTGLSAAQAGLAEIQATIATQRSRIVEIEIALQGDALTKAETNGLLDEAKTLIEDIQKVTTAAKTLEGEISAHAGTLAGMASARSSLDETAHVAAELTPDAAETNAVSAQLGAIQNIKPSQIKALDRALATDLPGDLVGIHTLVNIANGKLGAGEIHAMCAAIASGLPVELQQQTLEALGDTALTAGSVKALAAATKNGAFEGREGELLQSLASGKMTPGGLKKLVRNTAPDKLGKRKLDSRLGTQIAATEPDTLDLQNIAPGAGGARPSVGRDLRKAVSSAAKQSAGAARKIGTKAAKQAAKSAARQAAKEVRKTVVMASLTTMQEASRAASFAAAKASADAAADAAAKAAAKAAAEAAAQAAAKVAAEAAEAAAQAAADAAAQAAAAAAKAAAEAAAQAAAEAAAQAAADAAAQAAAEAAAQAAADAAAQAAAEAAAQAAQAAAEAAAQAAAEAAAQAAAEAAAQAAAEAAAQAAAEAAAQAAAEAAAQAAAEAAAQAAAEAAAQAAAEAAAQAAAEAAAQAAAEAAAQAAAQAATEAAKEAGKEAGKKGKKDKKDEGKKAKKPKPEPKPKGKKGKA
jgi:hypothetical protein